MYRCPQGRGGHHSPITVTVGHLNAGTGYHYRLIATNPTGSARGHDRHFTTKHVCLVPRLGHKTLAHAIKLLHRQHCTLGHVTRHRTRAGGRLVVTHQSRQAGSRHRAHTPVGLSLRPASGAHRRER